MVRINAVTLIKKYCVRKCIRPMMKWSTRENKPSAFLINLKKEIRDLLNLISGNDICELIKSNCILYFKIKNNLI